jgi:hypothetical protein
VVGCRGDGVDGRRGKPLSDIGILNDPVSLIELALLFGSPGFVGGAITGALLWRRRRLAGGLLGAVIGFAAWLAGWMWFKDLI